jgi:hypothetical protein
MPATASIPLPSPEPLAPCGHARAAALPDEAVHHAERLSLETLARAFAVLLTAGSVARVVRRRAEEYLAGIMLTNAHRALMPGDEA